jgi:hypothetical protein
MKVYKEDWSEQSVPLVHHKGNQERDITSKECPVCQRSVQVIGGKMQKHDCVADNSH